MWISGNEKKKLLVDSCFSQKTYGCVIRRKSLQIQGFASNMASWQKIYIKSKRLITSEFIFQVFLI